MLIKPTPDNVSIVSPEPYERSALLKRLSGHFGADTEHYLGSIFIDLRHDTPQTDGEFLVKLAGSIREALGFHDSELAQILNETDAETLADMLQLVFDTLADRKKRLLVILDGFDFLPIGTGISPNLFDQLRSLAEMPSLCLVIGSRKRLRELCMLGECRCSDFWCMFNEPLFIGHSNDNDGIDQ